MSDTNTQLAARAAAVDPSQRAAVEHRRLRACSPELVALLAYCGDETARERVPETLRLDPCPQNGCVWARKGIPGCEWDYVALKELTPEEWARGLAPLLQVALDDPAVRRVAEALFAAWAPAKGGARRYSNRAWDYHWRKTLAMCLAADAEWLGPRIRDVARDAVRREVFGDRN